jgi:hypothetical protein
MSSTLVEDHAAIAALCLLSQLLIGYEELNVRLRAIERLLGEASVRRVATRTADPDRPPRKRGRPRGSLNKLTLARVAALREVVDGLPANGAHPEVLF